MWSRVCEFFLGCWLLMSPFIFHHADTAIVWWSNDLVTGGAVVLLSLLSYWHPLRNAHLLIIAVGFWLVGFAYWYGLGEAAAASQNQLIVGLLLLMFAIIPNGATLPASEWQQPHDPLAGRL